MTFTVLLLLVLVSLGNLSLASAQSKMFSLDLSQYGWQSPTHEPGNEREFGHFSQIAFGDNQTVYVGYSLTPGPALHHPDSPRFDFRVLSINTENGSVSRTLNFQTRSKYRVGLTTSTEGKLLVIANAQAQMVGANGSLEKTFQFPLAPHGNVGEIWGFDQSASGKTLSLSELDTYVFVRADTLTSLETCTVSTPEDRPWTFSDSGQLSVSGRSLRPELMSAGLCGKPNHLRWLESDFGNLVLLADSSMLSVGRDRVRRWSKNGDLVWSHPIAKHFVSANVRPSRDGSRFAIEWSEEKGGSRLLDTDPKTRRRMVIVYDARTGEQLGAVKTPNQGIRGFALSFQGNMLAIRYDGTLELWKF